MKKALLLSALAVAALTANAEVVRWDFYKSCDHCAALCDTTNAAGLYWGPKNNYDYVNKAGIAQNTDSENLYYLTDEYIDGVQQWGAKANTVISLKDGKTYKKQDDGSWKNLVIDEMTEEVESETILDETQPVICWGPKGMARTLWMNAWGTTDEWADKDYNAATPEDWTPQRYAIAFYRLSEGTKGVREDTYIQFPAVEGNSNVTVWASHTGSSYVTELRVKIVPIVNGEEKDAFCYFLPLVAEDGGRYAEKKRYYKLTAADLDKATDADGNRLWADAYKGEDKVTYRIGCHKSELNIHAVEFTTEGGSGVAAVAAENNDNTTYNIFGQRVDASYKGIVIRGGKKFIQR